MYAISETKSNNRNVRKSESSLLWRLVTNSQRKEMNGRGNLGVGRLCSKIDLMFCFERASEQSVK